MLVVSAVMFNACYFSFVVLALICTKNDYLFVVAASDNFPWVPTG
jgi:hypothetical protein